MNDICILAILFVISRQIILMLSVLMQTRVQFLSGNELSCQDISQHDVSSNRLYNLPVTVIWALLLFRNSSHYSERIDIE